MEKKKSLKLHLKKTTTTTTTTTMTTAEPPITIKGNTWDNVDSTTQKFLEANLSDLDMQKVKAVLALRVLTIRHLRQFIPARLTTLRGFVNQEKFTLPIFIHCNFDQPQVAKISEGLNLKYYTPKDLVPYLSKPPAAMLAYAETCFSAVALADPCLESQGPALSAVLNSEEMELPDNQMGLPENQTPPLETTTRASTPTPPLSPLAPKAEPLDDESMQKFLWETMGMDKYCQADRHIPTPTEDTTPITINSDSESDDDDDLPQVSSIHSPILPSPKSPSILAPSDQDKIPPNHKFDFVYQDIPCEKVTIGTQTDEISEAYMTQPPANGVLHRFTATPKFSILFAKYNGPSRGYFARSVGTQFYDKSLIKQEAEHTKNLHAALLNAMTAYQSRKRTYDAMIEQNPSLSIKKAKTSCFCGKKCKIPKGREAIEYSHGPFDMTTWKIIGETIIPTKYQEMDVEEESNAEYDSGDDFV